MNRSLLILVWFMLTIASSVPLYADDRSHDFFEQNIRPILATRCFRCHGPDQQKSGLRLDIPEGLKGRGKFGTILVPGDPEKSVLYTALSHQFPKLKMPYQEEPLSPSIVAHFKKWIESGAAWPPDFETNTNDSVFNYKQRVLRLPWIWRKPVKPSVPSIQNPQWPLNSVDHFVHNKLTKAGLKPATDSDPVTWLRRVYFAITGLPPTQEAIQNFIDNESSDRYSQVTDSLLGSPHFGERWARHWMDLVRYSESRGHESDFIIPNAYHYRDYLIRAYNADVPYDRFIREHLAGDLLPNPRLNPDTGSNESILATAWPFLGEEVHSPVDIRQDECERLDNKIDVFSKTFFGLTLSCARCHDHKFDAIPQSDYYAMAGFLLSSSYRQVRFETMESNARTARALHDFENSFQQQLRRFIVDSFQPSLSDIKRYWLAAAKVVKDPSSLEDTIRNQSVNRKQLTKWISLFKQSHDQPDSPLYLLARAIFSDNPAKDVPLQTIRDNWSTDLRSPVANDTHVIADFSDTLSTPWLTNGFSFGLSPRGVGSLSFSPVGTTPVLSIFTYGAAIRDPIWDSLSIHQENDNEPGAMASTERSNGMIRTPTVTLRHGLIHHYFVGKAKVYASVDSHIMMAGPLHKTLIKELESDEPTWITHDLRDYKGHRVHFEFGPIGTAPCNVLQVVEGPNPPSSTLIANRFPSLVNFQTCQTLEDYTSVMHRGYSMALKRFNSPFNSTGEAPKELASWIHWMLQTPELFSAKLENYSQQIDRFHKDYHGHRANRMNDIQLISRTAVAWLDGNGINEQMLLRGDYRSPDVIVARNAPRALQASLPPDVSGSGRLQLADQMSNPDNPLIARVMVNRIWHHLFGNGIVRTVNNFGWLGDRPSHPQLLDYLSVVFVENDHWSVKSMIRRLVMSRTFRMSSNPANELAKTVDPLNRLLHRMPVRRLEAESIRDNLLAVSGRLDRTLFGIPVPVHLTEFVIGRGRPTESGPLDGEGRRTVYTAVRRNFLPTMLLTFNMPIPFNSIGRRTLTNVPSQSLALMNDKLVYQQARFWAERILAEHVSGNTKARIRSMYWTAFGRPAADQEVNLCRKALEKLAISHDCDFNDVRVWTDLCHSLFQANEFIYLR